MRILLVLLGGLVLGSIYGSPAATLRDGLRQPEDWFRGEAAVLMAENILSWQSSQGSWPKNQATASQPYAGEAASLRGTFDNGATVDELRFLARMFQASEDPRYRESFSRGLDHVLEAQYPNGGWPQHYPPGRGYHRHITFNDDVMVRLLEFLREVATSDRYHFLDEETRRAAGIAFERGIECILNAQIRIDGTLTAWCAQHDELDLSPRPGRSYELASLSGAESVRVVRLLMSLEQPRPQVIAAIEAAVAWFESVKLEGIRLVRIQDPAAPGGTDRVVVADEQAPPMWARFYTLDTQRALFAGRDGVPQSSLAEIEHERRNGYAWLGYWPAALIEKDYPAWRAANRLGPVPQPRKPGA